MSTLSYCRNFFALSNSSATKILRKHISFCCSRTKISVGSSEELNTLIAVMDSSESLNQTQDSEAHALVRQFSLEVAPNFTYPHAIHAVADYSRHQREIEAAKWRPHFQDPNAARYKTHEVKKANTGG